MKNLLRAGIRRYRTNFVFWLAAAASVVAGIYGGHYCRVSNVGGLDMPVLIELIIFAVMIAWIIGREYEDGGFHNKVIAGHTRSEIYASELLLAVLACTVLFLIHAVIFICLNLYTFSVITPGVFFGFFFGFLFANLAVAALFVVLAFLLRNRFAIVAVLILMVYGLYFIGYETVDAVDSEQYILDYDYEVFEDDYGNVIDIYIEGTEHMVENPRYIGGPLRTVCEILSAVNPCGHVIYYDWMTYGLFGKYMKGWTEGDSWENFTNEFVYDGSAVAVGCACAVAVFAALAAAGVPCFRRRELR